MAFTQVQMAPPLPSPWTSHDLSRLPFVPLGTCFHRARRLSGLAAAQATASPPMPMPLPRRSANYPSTPWKDGYLQQQQGMRSDFNKEGEEEKEECSRIERLKADTRQLFVVAAEKKDVVEQLELIDALQQLGVAYHFEVEIMDALATALTYFVDDNNNNNNNNNIMFRGLHATALIFRLLRERGFEVSHDVFNSFKDESGCFEASLCSDIRGLLSLYQASYVAKEGESSMEDARDFTTKHLIQSLYYPSSSSCCPLDPQMKEQVGHALELPLNWRMQRLHTRWFIDMYERRVEENMSPLLLELAKLDFNKVQRTYNEELKVLSRWWTDLDLLGGNQMSFVRDRLVETFYWAVGAAFEPGLHRCRIEVTKCGCLITTIDDIYDVYGSLDELELFTQAVQKWDVSAMQGLPDYMKICLLALFNTTHDTTYRVLKHRGIDITPYLKKAWIDLCDSYLVEARWYHMGYTPTLDEYLDNAWVSVSEPLLLTLSYCLHEDVTPEDLQGWEHRYYDIMRWSSMILRLADDLGTSMVELERGDVPKSIHCYMHESGASEDEAREHIKTMIADFWKKLNGDRIATSPLEKYFKDLIINTPRAAQCIYQHGDGYGAPQHETKDRIISIMIQPIIL